MADSPSVPQDTVRTYVLDTSVLLSDPWACTRFAEHHVVVPLVVISELEAKRYHHELGWFARQALRLFDDRRVAVVELDVKRTALCPNGNRQIEPSVLQSKVVE